MTTHVNGKSKTNVSSHQVEVALKAGFPDSSGAAILAQFPALGVQTVNEVRVGALYEITGPLSSTQVHALAHNFLADPITQDFFLNGARPSDGAGAPCWRVEVWLKPAVSDSVGESVRKAVTDLGLPTPERVRCGTTYRLLGRASQAQAEKIAVKLLANPVIHRFSVTSV